MGDVIGQLLPLAVGVAISPVPVIAVILMLFAPRAGGTGSGFLLGWVAGIVVATLLVCRLATATGMDGTSGQSTAASWVKLILGVLLLVLGVKQWRQRPAPASRRRCRNGWPP